MFFFPAAGDLVHGLVTSTDGNSNSQAIKNADAYLRERDTESNAAKSSRRLQSGGQDRTVINRGPPAKGSGDSPSIGSNSAAALTADVGRYFRGDFASGCIVSASPSYEKKLRRGWPAG